MTSSSGSTERPARNICQQAMCQAAPKTVTFVYVDGRGEESRREAEPYEIKGDTLFAWCLGRQEIRQFKLDRMSETRVGKHFRARQRIVIPLD